MKPDWFRILLTLPLICCLTIIQSWQIKVNNMQSSEKLSIEQYYADAKEYEGSVYKEVDYLETLLAKGTKFNFDLGGLGGVDSAVRFLNERKSQIKPLLDKMQFVDLLAAYLDHFGLSSRN